MLIYQALYYVQLIVFQGGGRCQSLTDVRAFPTQSARLRLIRYAQSRASDYISSDGLSLVPLWETSR